MKTIKQLLLTILNAVKAYCKRVRDLQDEVIAFNEKYRQYLEGKK